MFVLVVRKCQWVMLNPKQLCDMDLMVWWRWRVAPPPDVRWCIGAEAPVNVRGSHVAVCGEECQMLVNRA